MKVIRQLGQGKQGHCTIKLSQSEWAEIGRSTGWKNDIEKVKPTEPAEDIERLEPVDLSAIKNMEITVEKYGDRLFAIYLSGDLLAVTAYKRGAAAIKEILTSMQEDIVGLDMAVRLQKEKNGKLEREILMLREQLEANENGLIPVLIKERNTSQSG
jgi:hypothetical protein